MNFHGACTNPFCGSVYDSTHLEHEHRSTFGGIKCNDSQSVLRTKSGETAGRYVIPNHSALRHRLNKIAETLERIESYARLGGKGWRRIFGSDLARGQAAIRAREAPRWVLDDPKTLYGLTNQRLGLVSKTSLSRWSISPPHTWRMPH
jgi:hypothetical protein